MDNTPKKKFPAKKLEDWMIELAILWIDVEGLTLREVITRLVDYFGEEYRVTHQAVDQRVKRRRVEYAEGGIHVKNKLHNPADLTDVQLLDWFRYILYSQIYSAQSGNRPAETRRAIEAALKVMKAKKEVAQSDGDDIKAMQALLAEVQGKDKSKVLN